MTGGTLAGLEMIARAIAACPDNRPGWLREMPSASDSTALYYRFLWAIAAAWKPDLSIEIGTYKAVSAAHLASGHPGGLVVTVDNDSLAVETAWMISRDHNLANLIPIHEDSARAVRLLRGLARRADILFVDGLHNFDQCYGEYEMYRPLVADGGLILFDDIHVSREMEAAWRRVLDPKIELGLLHYTGFGAVVKDPSVHPPSRADVVAEATKEFSV